MIQTPITPSLGVHVYCSSRTIIGAWWNGMGLKSEFWRLYCNDTSGAAIESESGTVPLRPGRLYVIPPRFAGAGRVEGDVGHTYSHFEVTGIPHTLVPTLFPAIITLPRNALFETLRKEWLAHIPYTSQLSSPLPGYALAAMALAYAVEAFNIAANPQWKVWLEGAHRFANLEQWLLENLAGELSVAQLASRTGVTPDHFRRIFFRVFGMTPARYITELRIKAAATRLAFTGDSIDSIAEACGFSDRHYFTRVFATRLGLGPAAYRRNHGTGRPENSSLMQETCID